MDCGDISRPLREDYGGSRIKRKAPHGGAIEDGQNLQRARCPAGNQSRPRKAASDPQHAVAQEYVRPQAGEPLLPRELQWVPDPQPAREEVQAEAQSD